MSLKSYDLETSQYITQFSFDKFKEEIFGSIHQIEKKLNSDQEKSKETINYNLNYIESKLTDFSIKLTDINNTSNLDKEKLEKINELIINQKKQNDQLISHEIKINNAQKDLVSSCYKYDRIYLDNLIIPGLIGEYCKFKNLKEYIENNLNQVSALNSFKDKFINE